MQGLHARHPRHPAVVELGGVVPCCGEPHPVEDEHRRRARGGVLPRVREHGLVVGGGGEGEVRGDDAVRVGPVVEEKDRVEERLAPAANATASCPARSTTTAHPGHLGDRLRRGLRRPERRLHRVALKIGLSADLSGGMGVGSASETVCGSAVGDSKSVGT